MQGHRRARLAAGLLAAVAGLAACTSAPDTGAVPDTAPTTPAAPAPVAPVVQEDVGEVPLARDAGYDAAVAAFGAGDVAAAATTAARVAHIALADCVRWRTGTMDPRLGELLTPALLDRVTAELDLPDGNTTSLLSHLPRDDGNGHRLASDIVLGCDGSAPLRYAHGSLAVAVDGTGGAPRLGLTGTPIMDVAFGPTRVQAAQDWVFTTEQSDGGWRLAGVTTGGAHVNWLPPQ